MESFDSQPMGQLLQRRRLKRVLGWGEEERAGVDARSLQRPCREMHHHLRTRYG